MGNASVVSKKEIKNWKKRYHIPQDKAELTLRAFRSQMNKEDRTISKEKFIEIMAEHGAADEEFATAIFESFDADESGKIDIQEYLSLMGITFGGSVEEKLQASFRLFDKDGDGELDADEIENMLMMATRAVVRKQYNASQQQAHNKIATGKTEVEIPEPLRLKIKEIVAEIFEKVDTDGNGKLSLEEFTNGFAEHPEICSFFKQF